MGFLGFFYYFSVMYDISVTVRYFSSKVFIWSISFSGLIAFYRRYRYEELVQHDVLTRPVLRNFELAGMESITVSFLLIHTILIFNWHAMPSIAS